MPVKPKDVIAAMAEEALRQVHGMTGPLKDDAKAKAAQVAKIAEALAADFAADRIDATQFADGSKNLVLATRSALAGTAIDAIGKRRQLAQAAISVLLKGAVAALL